jgi:hypothetical protein
VRPSLSTLRMLVERCIREHGDGKSVWKMKGTFGGVGGRNNVGEKA